MDQFNIFDEKTQCGSLVGGKYKLLEKISEGGGGIVWKAKDPQEQDIALKLLKWSPLKSKIIAAEKFKNEFAILKSLSHPNIAKIYDFGHDPNSDQYYFTSEIIAGGDLKQFVKGPIEILEDLFIQALRSLEYLNNHKLLHLDLKPQNLLIKNNIKEPTLALIDFGLASFQAPERPGGTPNYMPPELVIKRLELPDEEGIIIDHRTDLYSLGVTFYYCLTGIQPFLVRTPDGKRINSQATLLNHLETTPPPPSTYRDDIPSYLDRVIMKMISRNSTDRYPSAIVAAQAIQYSSPRIHNPETEETLLAYIPKEGKLIGRKKEAEIIAKTLESLKTYSSIKKPFIGIYGGKGSGKTRFLNSIVPFAQRLELNVISIDEFNVPSLTFFNKLLSNKSGYKKRPTLLLIDSLDRIAEAAKNRDEKCVNLINIMKSISKQIKFASRFPDKKNAQILLIYSINPDNFKKERLYTLFDFTEKEHQRIDLHNFSKVELKEYLTTLLGETPDLSVVEQLIKSTGGNPLYLTEHLEHMIAKGRLFSLAGRPDSKTLKKIGVDFSRRIHSKSFTDDFKTLYSKLPADAKSIALLIACIGQPLSSDEIKHYNTASFNYANLLSLIKTGILRKESKSGKIRFVNDHCARIIKTLTPKSEVSKHYDMILNVLKNRKSKQANIKMFEAFSSNKIKAKAALKFLSEKAFQELRTDDYIEYLRELERITSKDEHEEILNIRVRIADSLMYLGRTKDAIHQFRTITKIKSPKGFVLNYELIALEGEGRCYMRRRDIPKAKKVFESALKKIGQKKNYSIWKIKFENYIAGALLREGKIEEAVRRYEKTSAVAKKILKRRERVMISNNELGEAYLRLGKPKKALSILKHELKDANDSENAKRIADRHYLIGNAMRSDTISDLKSAKDHYLKALKVASKHRLPNLEVRILNGMGNLFLMMNNPKLALKYYEDGFKLSQQIDSMTTSVEIMVGMGLTAQKLGNPDAVIEYFEAAMEFSGGPKGKAAGLIRRFFPTIYVSLGDAYYQTMDFEKATEYLDKARALDKKNSFSADLRYSLYGTYTEIYLTYENYEEAKKYMPTLKAIVKSLPQAKKHFDSLNKKMRTPS